MSRGLPSLFRSFTVVLLLACGPEQTVGKRCSSDESCNTGEICPPSSGRCARTCTGNAGCPSSQPTCAPLDGSGFADGGLGLKVCT